MAIEKNISSKEIVEKIINSAPEEFETRNNDDEFAYIQLSSFCSNDCMYCSYSRENWTIERKRITAEEAVAEAKKQYDAGKKYILLYGGLDIFYTAEKIAAIIKKIKEECPDSVLYAAFEERVYEDYKVFYDAGADGFILPHRSANEDHFSRLHPMDMYPDFRKNVLPIIKEMGMKIGTGITVGWPYQTAEMLAEDIEFVKNLEFDLVVVDRFIPQQDTDFESFAKGDIRQTEKVRGIVSELLPDAIILSKLELC